MEYEGTGVPAAHRRVQDNQVVPRRRPAPSLHFASLTRSVPARLLGELVMSARLIHARTSATGVYRRRVPVQSPNLGSEGNDAGLARKIVGQGLAVITYL